MNGLAAFARYRWQAYQQQLIELSRQLRQLGTLTVVLLGTALPAVFLLLFYSIGLVVQHPAGAMSATIQAISLLLLQCLLWYLLRPAVLDLPHRLFQHSLSSASLRFSCDMVLLWLSAPLVWAVSYLMFEMTISQLQAAPQLVLLWLLLICAGPLVLYRPGRLLWGGVGGVLALSLLTGLWQTLHGKTLLRPDSFILLATFAGGALPLLILPAQTNPRPVQLRSVWHFWWQYLLLHRWPLSWRLLLVVLNRQLWQTVTQFRPDASVLWHSLAFSLELLLLASLLFVSKAQYSKHQRYFQSLGQQGLFWRCQFVLVVAPLLLWLTLLSLLLPLSVWQYLTLPLLAAGLLLVIYRWPAHYFLAWLTGAVALVALR